MAIQSQYILVKKANGDVGITQNSVEVFSSINASAVVNTLVLKEGKVGIGTDTPACALDVLSPNYPPARLVRTTSDTNLTRSAMVLQHRTTADMIDALGVELDFGIRDVAGVDNVICDVHGYRDGADNSGKMFLRTYNAGTGNNNLSLTKEGYNGFGLDSPTTRLHVQVASNKNVQALLIEQLDTTNNPICAEINNDGTNHGLYIHQDGVLVGGLHALYVTSSAAQINSSLVRFYQQSGSSTTNTLLVHNGGKGNGLYIQQDVVLDTNRCSLYVYTDVAQINSSLVLFRLNNASATGTVLEITNGGTGHGIYIHQDGKLADSKHALYIYNNTNQNVSNLVKIEQASSADCQTVVSIINAQGWGSCVTISQTGVLQATSNALLVGSNAVQVNEYLLHFWQNNASSTAGVQKITNNGSGTGLLITQNGNGSALVITNVGTKNGIWIDQQGAIGAGYPALKVYSNTAQVNDSFVQFYLNHASSTRNVLELSDKGTGGALIIQQVGNGTAQEIYNAGTGHALYIHTDGNLASGKYALYIDNNGTPAAGAGRCIRLDGCTISSTKSPETDAEAGFIAVNIDGTQMAIPYYALS